LAKHFGCKFIETSAKQRINVDEAFSQLVREIRRYNKVSLSISSTPSIINISPLLSLGTTRRSPYGWWSRHGCWGWPSKHVRW
jgi:hypothetical protein